MTDLDGTGALLVGASGHLGAQLARRLSAHGARLVLAGRDVDRLAAVLSDLPGPAWSVSGDLTDPAATDRLIDVATARLERVDLLVYAAGVDTVAATVTQSDDRVSEQLTVNLAAPIRLTRRLLPDMLDRRSGHMVFIGSIAALAGGAYQAPYAAAKAGLDAWVRALRAEHRDAGVGFSIVHPSPIRDVGRYPRRRRAQGRPPGPLSEITAASVADAVLQAIRSNRPQIIVGSPLVRAQLMLQALTPGVAERTVARAGIVDYFRRLASTDERHEP